MWPSRSHRLFCVCVYMFIAAVGGSPVCLEFSDQGDDVGGPCSVDGEVRNSYKIVIGKRRNGRTTCEI